MTVSADALHIVCPHCHTTNRVRVADLHNDPDCGQCHQALFDGHPLALDAASFDKHIGRNQIPVLVDFWAEWCGPCRAIGPVVEELSKEFEGRVNVGKVNVDHNPQLSMNYGITSIPAILFIKNGQVVDKLVGAQPKHSFVKKIESHI